MSELQKHADDVMHRLDRRRKAHACYPCAKRKVRCHGGHPCSICKKRGHPEICFFATSSSSPQPPASPASDKVGRHPARLNVSLVDASDVTDIDERIMVAASSTSETHDSAQPTPTRTAVGNLSGATYVQHALSSHTTQALGHIRSGLGLENAPMSGTDDSHQLGGSFQRSRTVDLCPKRSEVLRFLPPFRTHVAPFYPIILSVDELELSMHKLLDDVERQSADSVESLPFSHSASDEKRAADIALFLSVLAVGAQFADAPSQVRETQSQSLIERCDACLRLARYTANPSPQIVQTLILVGLQAQNAGRSDEAWSLLGLTFRLAQSLGMEGQTEADQHFLWGSIIWQDTLLSVRYDRKPIYTQRLSLSQSNVADERGYVYLSCMHDICKVARAWLLCDGSERCDATAMQQRITSLAQVQDSAAPFLRDLDQCACVQQRLKFYALRMHASFLTSEMCRPFLIKPASASQPTQTKTPELHKMGVSCLERTVEAYLEMSHLSIVPLRSWSLTYEAFTAVCVLTLLELRHASETIDSLLRKFQLLLERELASEKAHEAATYSMLRRGRKLFKLLESSAQYSRMDIAGRSRQGQLADTDDPHRDRTLPETVDRGEILNEHSSEFETFVDRFWESVPFSEPDGNLLSLFDDQFFGEFSSSNISPTGNGFLGPGIGNDSWY